MEISDSFVEWAFGSWLTPELGAVLAFLASAAYLARWQRKNALKLYFAGLGAAWFLMAVILYLFSIGQLSTLSFRFYARLAVYILATGTLVEHGSYIVAAAYNKWKDRKK